VLDVRRWAEIRRMREVEGLSIHEIVRRTGHDRNTVRRALRREGPPRYQRPPRPSKLDPFKDEIHRLLQADPKLPGKRIRELIEELGYAGSKTILDDYLREVRPLFERRRTFQRTVYRSGELLQLDLWGAAHRGPGRARPDAPRLGRDRRAWLVACDRRRADLL
jgi:transposase